MFTSRVDYLGPILTAVFVQQTPVFPAYFQFTRSRTAPNPFNRNKIQNAGGLYGDESRPDCERSRNQKAFGGRAHTTAQNCRSRSARTFPPAGRARLHRRPAQPRHDPVWRVYLEA